MSFKSEVIASYNHAILPGTYSLASIMQIHYIDKEFAWQRATPDDQSKP